MVHTEYAEDEGNSATTTVLFDEGRRAPGTGSVGIHGAHLADNTHIEYITTDPKRQMIPQVIYTAADGKQTIYNATDTKVTPEELARGERRTMDCIDCHNRPTHMFPTARPRAGRRDGHRQHQPLAARSSRSRRWPRCKKNYPDRDTGARADRGYAAAGSIKHSYPQVYAQDQGGSSNAIAAVQAIYARNIFPEMKVTWGTYLNNLGHMDSPGCFRCHDGSHTSADGRTIPNDCATCHELMAMDEKNPKILTDLGIVPAQAPARRRTN